MTENTEISLVLAAAARCIEELISKETKRARHHREIYRMGDLCIYNGHIYECCADFCTLSPAGLSKNFRKII